MPDDTPSAAGGIRLEQILSDLQSMIDVRLVSREQEIVLMTQAEFWDGGGQDFSEGSIVLVPSSDLAILRAADLGRMQAQRVGCLVVRDAPGAKARARSIVDDHRLPVVVLGASVSWFQVTGLIRERLLTGTLGVDDFDGLEQMGQGLTQIAEAVSALIGAPVIIQDPDFHILAYSQHQQGADHARTATVLAASLPDEYRRVLDEVDAIERVYGSDGAEFIELGEGLSPRLAVAIRTGADILGSMWAAVSGPVSPRQRKAFAEAAGAAALALLQRRSILQARKSLRDRLLASLLTDSRMAGDARARLGLSGRAVAVLVVTCDGHAEDPEELQRVTRALDLHLQLAATNSAAVIIGSAAYGVVPLRDVAADLQATVRTAERFLRRMANPSLRIGIGRPATSIEGIHRSRHDAEATVRAERAHGSAHTVATFEGSLLHVAMLALHDRFQSDDVTVPFGALRALVEYDAAQQSDLVRTLRSMIRVQGDITRAAAALNVHPNTVRYRLTRIEAVAGIDPSDSDALFLAELQLRLMAVGSAYD